MNKEMKLGVTKNALIVKFIGDVDNLVCEPYKNKLETIINKVEDIKIYLKLNPVFTIKITDIIATNIGCITIPIIEKINNIISKVINTHSIKTL